MSPDETIVQIIKICLGIISLVAFLLIANKIIDLLTIIAHK